MTQARSLPKIESIPALPSAPPAAALKIPAQGRLAALEHRGPLPWLQLRNAVYSAALYRKMLGRMDPRIRDGDLVKVYDRDGVVFGTGLLNRQSALAVRMLSFGDTPLDESFLDERLRQALAWRRDILQLPARTEAWRLVHAEGDGLPGLIADIFGDTVVVELFSLAMFRRADQIVQALLAQPGIRHVRFRADAAVQQAEGFQVTADGGWPGVAGVQPPFNADPGQDRLVITEHGVRFQVDLAHGHKTGFFCDQRDNRLGLTTCTAQAAMLDLCCYSGGLGIYALVRGQAASVTALDLDESALTLARRNANLNHISARRYETVHADAFPYLRQMRRNNRWFDVVVLDPPKLIAGREDFSEGRQSYFDLNKLALAVVRPGGILLTCSCSGLLDLAEFLNVLRGAARSAQRQVQIWRISGAGPDHPIRTEFPEGLYLKCLWCRVW